MPRRALSWIFMIFFVLGMLGCITGAEQKTTELLALDYRAMTDVELQAYYHQLSDQLARQSRATRTAGGSGQGSGSGGAGVSQPLGDDSGAPPLRTRWNAVRRELRERGLLH